MNNSRISAIAIAFVCFALLSGLVYGHGGGGGGGHGGGGGGFHGGGGGGGWHGGGGIAGGGWHGGGLPGGGHVGGFGGLPGGGHVGGFGGLPAGGLGGAGFGHVPGGHLPGAGIGGVSGFPGHGPVWNGGLAGHGPGWTGGFPGHGLGWAGGIPGAAGYWGYAHPYSWYNGHWHNHWYGNGFGGYWGLNYPLGWGLAGWGLGSLWYNSGYMPYYNPYYAPLPGVAGAYNYAQPIPIASAPPADGLNAGAGLADAGNPDVDLAVAKFQANDYAGALALVDGVIRVQPADAAAHELRALILFAMQDYSQAAATIHSVLAIGPGWDWTTLSSLYPDIQIYTQQLQALENYVSLHPRQADARFLLAYHYMTEGHTDAAAGQLKAAVDLKPNDKLAADLLRMVGSAGAAPPPPAAVAEQPAGGQDLPPVDPAALAGDWHASRDDGARFELDLAPDKTFTWKFTQQQQTQTISGTYSVDNSILILQGKTSGAMVAQVSTDGADRFTFKPVGAPTDDPGLTFAR
jgi:tetratricopeptide (TPR) repeat protein